MRFLCLIELHSVPMALVRVGLLAVDLQDDFNEDGVLPVPGARTVSESFNALAQELEKILPGPYLKKYASLDWHEEGHIGEQKWPRHCIQNKPGSALIKEFKSEGYLKIFKGTNLGLESYSAFGSEDALITDGPKEVTPLHSLLTYNGISVVVLGGLALDVCVLYSALDSKKRGFTTIVVLEACRSLSPEGQAKAITQMLEAGILVVSTKEECVFEIKKFFK